MTIEELNKLIEVWEKNEGSHFLSQVRDETDFDLAEGITVSYVGGGRHNSEYIVRFSVGEQLYEAVGAYDSWGGTDMSYAEIIEVKRVQKMTTVYEPV